MTAAIVAAAAAVFLLAAKLHGRQLRLERERAGYPEASFRRGADNAPFVVALWRRERYMVWGTAVVCAGATALVRPALPWPVSFVLLPMTIGFAIGGILSLARARNRASSPR
jgi:hypothetical protein